MATIDMQVRPRGRQELSAWYSKQLAEQQSSGLSVTEYAEALGLAPTTLYQWRRRLSGATPSPAERGGTQASPGGLIRLSLPQRPAPAAHAGFVVRVGGDRRVEVPDDFDGEVLLRLVTVLERC